MEEIFAYGTFLFLMMNMDVKKRGKEKLWFCHYHFCSSSPAFDLSACSRTQYKGLTCGNSVFDFTKPLHIDDLTYFQWYQQPVLILCTSPLQLSIQQTIIRVQTPEAQGPHLTTPVQTLAFPRAYRALWVLIGNNLEWTLVGTGMSHSVTISPYPWPKYE